MELEYKPQFFDDLDDIAEYIAECFSSSLALEVVQNIYDDCRVLADQPYLGQKYPRDSYFRFLIVKKKNVVFYHVENETVTLHRIFDSRRDYIHAISLIEKNWHKQ
jgi:plasmid stabilization system protein ParE